MVKICIILEDIGNNCAITCEDQTPWELSVEELENSPAFILSQKIKRFIQSKRFGDEINEDIETIQ